MELAIVVGRLILTLVFFVAGIAKLADLPGARKSIIDFGVPSFLAATVSMLLPITELACAIFLLPASTAWYGAAGAFVLLALFITGISITLARGRAPDCHCFGQLHSSPVGWKTLTRNLALLSIAGFVVYPGSAAPQPSIFGPLQALTGTQLALSIGTAAIVVFMFVNLGLILQVMRQNGRMLLRIDELEKRLGRAVQPEMPEGLPVGSAAPDFNLIGLEGGEESLAGLLAERRSVMLFFTDPECGPCDLLLPEIAIWQRNHAALTLALISRRDSGKIQLRAGELGLRRVLLQKEREVAEAYLATATPAAVIVNPDGRIGTPMALGDEAIRALVAAATRPAPTKKGEPAPEVILPDLDGKRVDLQEFRGRPALLLFWNPGCGFCRKILDDVKGWERKRSADAPQLLVISTGTPEEIRAQGFSSPALLDPTFNAGYAFGAGGTPAAVLVAGDGTVASDAASGASEVLRLLGLP